MKILYDYQIFESQIFGGISRYFYELMKCFHLCIEGVDFNLPLLYTNNHYIKDALYLNNDLKKMINYDDFIFDFNFKGKWKLYQFAKKIGYIKNYSEINKKLSIDFIKKQDYDIFHPTYYDKYFLDHIGKKPFVLTVYDMIHELFPHEYNYDKDFCELKRLLIEKAVKVIAISESTKRDIVKLYDDFEDKIEVVYLGNSLDASVKIIGEAETPKKYLLFVGSRAKYKNFLFFIESAASVIKQDPELNVLCAGGGRFSESELSFFDKMGIAEKIIQRSYDDDMLCAVYKKALAFVFPSLYEGFGIPVLESFAAGCPLVVSNSSSLPEVAGDAALYIDPLDAESIKSAVEKVLNDEDLRKSLKVRGFEQLKKFSWNITAQKTKKIYEEIL